MTIYPTVDEVISTQAILIARFGGAGGIRDRGALESALAGPRSGYHPDVIQEAAALWESLSQKSSLRGRQQARSSDGYGSISEGERIQAGVR